MIYAKIYLDKDKNQNDVVVFDSVKEDVANHVTLAKEGNIARERTLVTPTSSIVVSNEAMKVLKDAIDPLNDNLTVNPHSGDFEFYKMRKSSDNNLTACFSYKPDSGKTSREFDPSSSFVICSTYDVDPAVLDAMIICDNEKIKNLNLTSPVDEEEFCPESSNN